MAGSSADRNAPVHMIGLVDLQNRLISWKRMERCLLAVMRSVMS